LVAATVIVYETPFVNSEIMSGDCGTMITRVTVVVMGAIARETERVENEEKGETAEVEEVEVKAAVELAMAASITDALTALQASRLDEGAALAPVLGGLVDRIEALVMTAEAQAAGQPSAIKEIGRAHV
jgi:uncharacterized protein YicC (UPF0701 family)